MAMKTPSRKMRRRTFFVVLPIVLVLFCALLARVGLITVVDSTFYQETQYR